MTYGLCAVAGRASLPRTTRRRFAAAGAFSRMLFIIAIAFYVVQWNLNLYLKALVVLTCSFAVTMVVVEALARGAKPLRMLFGMSPARKTSDASTESKSY